MKSFVLKRAQFFQFVEKSLINSYLFFIDEPKAEIKQVEDPGLIGGLIGAGLGAAGGLAAGAVGTAGLMAGGALAGGAVGTVVGGKERFIKIGKIFPKL